ncbi:MAG: PAN domain-containing protein [Pseudomonadota bacterium]
MRAPFALSALALMASTASADTFKGLKDIVHEPNTYRFGTPYQSHPEVAPAACASLCASDTACQVWVYVPASYTRADRCDLKTVIGDVEKRPGAISGLSTRLQQLGTMSELAGGPLATTPASETLLAPAPQQKPALETAPKPAPTAPKTMNTPPRPVEETPEDDPIFTIDPVAADPASAPAKKPKAPAAASGPLNLNQPLSAPAHTHASMTPINLTSLNSRPVRVLNYELRPAAE